MTVPLVEHTTLSKHKYTCRISRN